MLNRHNINGGKYTPGKWKYGRIDGTFLVMKEGVPPWPSWLHGPDVSDTDAEELKMVKQPSSHVQPQTGSEGGKAKKPKWHIANKEQDVLCNPHEGPSSSGTKEEEPKIATPFHKSPSNPGMKAEEPKQQKE